MFKKIKELLNLKKSIENNLIYMIILDDFLIKKNEWYYLGASMDKPIVGGLGEYI